MMEIGNLPSIYVYMKLFEILLLGKKSLSVSREFIPRI
jgi:hypothetical protein